MTEYATFRFTAGRTLWRRIREIKEMVNFMSLNGYVQIWESRGFFEREIIVKGDEKTVAMFVKEIAKLPQLEQR